MNLSELPGLITKHVGMLKAAAGEILDNPGFKSMADRQSVWSAKDTAIETRANAYQQLFGNTRGILEQGAGIAGITSKAVESSKAMFPDAATAQEQDQGTSTGQETLGGDVDTSRHLGLAARLSQQQPILGKAMLAAHENFGLYDSNPRESQRDTRNNAQGWLLGENIPESQIDPVTKKLTQVMSNNTAMAHLPIQVMAQRQQIWGK